MAKPGTNKERCKKYSASGHREANKARRQENNEKRIARFAKRREEGKAYKWEPNPYDPDTQRRKYVEEERIRAGKNGDRRDNVSKWRSVMRRLNNEIAASKLTSKRHNIFARFFHNCEVFELSILITTHDLEE